MSLSVGGNDIKTLFDHAFVISFQVILHLLDFGSAAHIKSMMLQYVMIDNLIFIMFQEEFQE